MRRLTRKLKGEYNPFDFYGCSDVNWKEEYSMRKTIYFCLLFTTMAVSASPRGPSAAHRQLSRRRTTVSYWGWDLQPTSDPSPWP